MNVAVPHLESSELQGRLTDDGRIDSDGQPAQHQTLLPSLPRVDRDTAAAIPSQKHGEVAFGGKQVPHERSCVSCLLAPLLGAPVDTF